MNMTDIRQAARERLKGRCRVCPVCNGKACAGEVPGMGGAGTGLAFMENVRAFAECKLNMRTLHEAAHPDMRFDFFGQSLSMPVMGAPMAGAALNLGESITETELAEALHAGCAGAGTLSFSGDGGNPLFYEAGLAAVRKQGRGVPTIKPREIKAVLERIFLAADAGATAVAVDVDTAGFINMTLLGQTVGPTGPKAIEALVKESPLPLILKGLMTPDEAELAVSLGVAGIIVSNHGGRVLDSCPSTLSVLPHVATAVRGRVPVLVDGGVRSGGDVLKSLALGANAVLIGRPLITIAAGGGAEGVTLYLNSIKAELSGAMVLTGVASVQSVSPRIVTGM